MSPPDTTFWKRKLAAFLHDPPSKAVDIRTHTERSEKAMQAAGLGTPEERRAWDRSADHTAAAADRFPFPHYSKASLSCSFDGVRNTFRHPLGGARGEALHLPFDGPFISAETAIEGEQTTQPVLKETAGMPESDQWRAAFFAHWRLWRSQSVEKDWRLGFLPADTRVPDHSIWTHMAVVSALESCATDNSLRPAFLKFQLGPVQDFIQAARSTRDLWSGSYLLSWLMAHGLAALSLQTGPDAVIFPSLTGQPLIDLALKNEIWNKVKIGDCPVWDSMNWRSSDLLTPNLPNVFLAIVPAAQAEEIARRVERGIHNEWKRIAESVWEGCKAEGLWQLEDGLPPETDRRKRFVHQIESFLSLSWSVTPWPESLEAAEALAASLPEKNILERYHIVKAAAETIRDLGHQDDRYFTNGKLNNRGLAWPLLVAMSSWQLDAARQTRMFNAAGTQHGPGRGNAKDSLTGKDEAVAGGEKWKGTGNLTSRFKHDDFLSAPTLVKRLWDKTYLHKAWKSDLGNEPFQMPNTRDLAAHKPYENTADDDSPPGEGESYFAVLAFDGDEVGKWISGEKTPPFGSQLANYEGGGSLEYFQRPAHADRFRDFLKTPRPLTPGYHLQFSEALSNFALRAVIPIVEAHDGRLIYAGGDDVVALLPADTALACANDLQLAFTGRAPLNPLAGIKQKTSGFLASTQYHEATGKLDSANENLIPFAVPGPAATASVGIAIAHFKSPLQDAVRAARAAEKRAKNKLGRAAVAVTVLKRSGETVEWGAKWESDGVQAAFTLLDALRDGVVSSKFPYRLAELMSVYRTQSAPIMKPMTPVEDFKLEEVFARELDTVLSRQRGPAWNEQGNEFVRRFTAEMKGWLQSMLKQHDIEHALTQLTALCAFCGFAKRLD